MCLCHYLTHHGFKYPKKKFFILKNNLEEFAFSTSLISERECMKVRVLIVGRKKNHTWVLEKLTQDMAPWVAPPTKWRDWGYHSRSTEHWGCLWNLIWWWHSKCIKWEQYPGGIKEHIWNSSKSIVKMFLVTAQLSWSWVVGTLVLFWLNGKGRCGHAEPHDFIFYPPLYSLW